MVQVLVQDYPIGALWKMKGSIFRTAASPRKIANFFRVKYSKARKSDAVGGMPLNILVEPTRDCNYSCIMCPRQTRDLAKHDIGNSTMSLGQFKKIMDELGPYLLTVRLWHYGEPLLAPDFAEMVKYAKKKGVFTATSSNVEKLTPDRADEIIDSGLDYLIVSINGATKKTYEKYCGKKKTFEKVLNNIAYLAKRKKERGSWHPFIDLQFIIMRENDRELEGIKRVAKTLGADKVCFKMVMGLTEKETKGFQSKDKQYQMPIREQNAACKFCLLPWEECVISANGEVSPCAVDIFNENFMGNVFNQPFREIWNSSKYLNFRQRVREDIDSIKVCSYCGKRNNPDFYVKV